MQPGNKIGKRSIKSRNAVGEAEPMGEETSYYFSCFALVDFHRGLTGSQQHSVAQLATPVPVPRR